MRLWGDAFGGETSKADAEALDAATEREADKLAGKPLSELLQTYAEQDVQRVVDGRNRL